MARSIHEQNNGSTMAAHEPVRVAAHGQVTLAPIAAHGPVALAPIAAHGPVTMAQIAATRLTAVTGCPAGSPIQPRSESLHRQPSWRRSGLESGHTNFSKQGLGYQGLDRKENFIRPIVSPPLKRLPACPW
jgi:hypothetical protein